MKIISIIISVIAIALIIFNATKINLDSPLAGDSKVAIITILASACAILLVLIFRVSKKIETLSKKNR